MDSWNDDGKKGFFDRLKSGLAKTRKLLLTDVDDILLGSKEIDQALFDELEEALIVADVGPAFTGELIASLKEKVKRKELGSPEILRKVLRETMREILLTSEAPLRIPPGRDLLDHGRGGERHGEDHDDREAGP